MPEHEEERDDAGDALGDVEPVLPERVPIDVSAYREVVLQLTSSSKSCTVGSVRPMFRQADDEVFAYSGQNFESPSNGVSIPGGRIRVDGPQLQLSFNGCALWRVVGVK